MPCLGESNNAFRNAVHSRYCSFLKAKIPWDDWSAEPLPIAVWKQKKNH